MAIAMTFDDGPSNKTTPQLLDLLDELNIQVTFFVLGSMVRQNPGVLRRIAAAKQQHEICNHSWSHPHFPTLSNDKLRSEIVNTQSLIEDVSGRKSLAKIVRPPYGHIKDSQKSFIRLDLGYRLIGWNVDSHDYQVKQPGKVVENIVTQTKDGQVILAHDIHEHTVFAMRATLKNLKQKFSFFSVSRLGNFTEGGFEDSSLQKPGRTPQTNNH